MGKEITIKFKHVSESNTLEEKTKGMVLDEEGMCYFATWVEGQWVDEITYICGLFTLVDDVEYFTTDLDAFGFN